MSKRRKKNITSEIHEARVESFSHDGRGITRLEGKTTFLSEALPGELVKFFYTDRRSKYDEGKVVDVLQASPDRAQPACAHFGICGGCSLQHLNHPIQIQLKEKILLEQLKYIGGTQAQELFPAITGPQWEYRRKARLGVRYVIKKEKVLIGFREKNGRYLADIQHCAILHPSIGANIHSLQELIRGLNAYESIPQIEIAIGDDISALIVRHLEELNNHDVEKLKKFAKTYHFYLYLQPGGTDSIHLLWPETKVSALSYRLPEHHIELLFQPTDFIQVNADINRQMVNRALEWLEINNHDEVLDLFCGLGNFTLPLAKYGKNVVGVEGSFEMVERAKINAIHNHLFNTEFYCANLAKDFSKESWAQRSFNKILLDPPRCGAAEIISHIALLNAERILYISCNPATLARDTAELIKQGYVLKKLSLVDMFPQTSHAEAMALFMKSP